MEQNIQIVPELILVQMVIFGLIYLILNHGIFRPFAAIVDERDRRTVGYQTIAGELELEANQLQQTVESRLDEARRASNDVRQKIRAEAYLAEQRIVGEASRRAKETVDELRKQLGNEIESARKSLQGTAQQLAEQIAAKLLI